MNSTIPKLCNIRKGIVYKMSLSMYTSESWFWSFILMHISILMNLSDNTYTWRLKLLKQCSHLHEK